MNTAFMRVALLWIALLSFPARADDEAAHARAVSKMLDATQFDLIVRLVWDRSDAPQPGHRQAMKHMAQHVPKAEILQRFTPVFAAHIDTRTALEISKAPNSAAGKALFAKASMPVKPAASKLMYSWADEYHDQLFIAAVNAALARVAPMTAASVAGVDPAPVKVDPTGVTYIDEVSVQMLDTGRRTALASAKLNRRYAEIGIVNVVTPDKLTSIESIAGSRTVLTQAGAALDIFVGEARLLLSDSVERYRRIDFVGAASNGEQLQAKILGGVASEQARLVHTEKNLRAMIDVERRILDFAAANQGKFFVQNGNLAFKDNVALAEYTRLYYEIEGAKAVIAAQAASAPKPQ